MLVDKVEEVKMSSELMNLYYKSMGMTVETTSSIDDGEASE